MAKSYKTEKIVVALILGAAVGVALGILFAPEKGSILSKKLLVKGDDLAHALKAKLKGVAQRVVSNDRGEIMDATIVNEIQKTS